MRLEHFIHLFGIGAAGWGVMNLAQGQTVLGVIMFQRGRQALPLALEARIDTAILAAVGGLFVVGGEPYLGAPV